MPGLPAARRQRKSPILSLLCNLILPYSNEGSCSLLRAGKARGFYTWVQKISPILNFPMLRARAGVISAQSTEKLSKDIKTNSIVCLFVWVDVFHKGRKVGVPYFRDLASRPREVCSRVYNRTWSAPCFPDWRHSRLASLIQAVGIAWEQTASSILTPQ